MSGLRVGWSGRVVSGRGGSRSRSGEIVGKRKGGRGRGEVAFI